MISRRISYLHRYVVSLTLKIDVVSLVISHQISYLHRYVLSLTLRPIFIVENIWRSKAVSTPSPRPTPILPIQSHNTPSPPLPHQTCQSCLHVYILLYYLQSYIITISWGRGVCGGGGCSVLRLQWCPWQGPVWRWWWGDGCE